MIEFKIMFDRVKNYIAMIQFMMVGYLFIINTEFNLIATIATVAGLSAILAIIDYKWLLPREYGKLAEKNPAIVKIIKKLDKIDYKLEVIK